MDINLDIKPEQINNMVSKAIIESSIGDALKKSIDDQVKKLNRGWDSPLDKVVQSEIEAACYRILREDYKAEIESAVKEKLSAHITDEFIGQVLASAMGKMLD